MDDSHVEPEESVEEPAPRRRPSTIGGACYLVVLTLAVAGLIVAATGAWVTGMRMLAIALVAAATARAVVPENEAGMLAVRTRMFDTGLLAGVGIAVWVLTASLSR